MNVTNAKPEDYQFLDHERFHEKMQIKLLRKDGGPEHKTNSEREAEEDNL